jgi:peptide/nickel transport system permease protein
MTTYIVRRLIQTLVMLVLLSYLCFTLMALMPGDPVELMIQSNPKIRTEDVARLRTLYGLDQPSYVRYANWAKTILSGDLGYSRTYRIPVADLMGPRLLNTFILSILSIIVSLIVAIPLGVFTALRAGTKWDYFINFFAFAGISVPSFWLGIILIIFFSVQLGWFPAGGTVTAGQEDLGILAMLADRAKYLVLPTLALAYMEIGTFLRFTRSAMLEAMRGDYIRTAKAKGLSRSTTIWAHGFRNALLNIITIVTLSFSTVFSGALITETLFSYQGVGKLVYDSTIGNDFNVAMVSFMISVAMVLVFNLIADILYGFVDPRISYT